MYHEGKKQKVLVIGNGVFSEVVKLDKSKTEKGLLVIFVATSGDKIDLTTITEHTERESTASVWIRGIVMGNAEVSVKGIIRIEKNAFKSESFLRQNILVLSDQARVDVRPELEILADDVKASHAATVGRIDEEQLFYVTSRGMSDEEAKRIIISGFLKTAIESIVNKKVKRETMEKLVNYC